MRAAFLLALTLLAGCAGRSATQRGAAAEAAAPLAVRALLTTKPAGVVALSGAIVEKCPAAGCWFRLKDGTGTVKVDLASAGFSISDLPLGTQVTATGTKQVEGSETSLCATGLRF